MIIVFAHVYDGFGFYLQVMILWWEFIKELIFSLLQSKCFLNIGFQNGSQSLCLLRISRQVSLYVPGLRSLLLLEKEFAVL